MVDRIRCSVNQQLVSVARYLNAHGGQKKASYHLELKLQEAISQNVTAGDPTMVFYSSSLTMSWLFNTSRPLPPQAPLKQICNFGKKKRSTANNEVTIGNLL